MFSTGDSTLDGLLEEARRRFLDPDPAELGTGVEKLWDAFERIKTLEDPAKATGIGLILDKASPPSVSPRLRENIDTESNTLTYLGNHLQIRHHETGTEAVSEREHFDYLFSRLFALIRLMLRKSGRGG